MPYEIVRKKSGKFQVVNKITGEIHAKGTTLKKAKAQVRLLDNLEGGDRGRTPFPVDPTIDIEAHTAHNMDLQERFDDFQDQIEILLDLLGSSPLIRFESQFNNYLDRLLENVSDPELHDAVLETTGRMIRDPRYIRWYNRIYIDPRSGRGICMSIPKRIQPLYPVVPRTERDRERNMDEHRDRASKIRSKILKKIGRGRGMSDSDSDSDEEMVGGIDPELKIARREVRRLYTEVLENLFDEDEFPRLREEYVVMRDRWAQFVNDPSFRSVMEELEQIKESLEFQEAINEPLVPQGGSYIQPINHKPDYNYCCGGALVHPINTKFLPFF